MQNKEAGFENLWLTNSLKIVDAGYLTSVGVDISAVNPNVLDKLRAASEIAVQTYSKMNGRPPFISENESLPLAPALKISDDLSLNKHGNTPFCAGNIREVIPAVGCQVNCLYCLAVSQNQPQAEVQYYDDYPTWFRAQLEANASDDRGFMYYVSPRTEVMSPETSRNGLAHGVFLAFRDHVLAKQRDGHPCKDTMFVVTKAGIQDALFEIEGRTLLDIFADIPDNIQINTSLTPLGNNEALRSAIEPGARSIDDRLRFIDALKSIGILSNGALVEPILFPYAFDVNFYLKLRQHGIRRIAIDLLTSSVENLVVVNQVVGWDSKTAEREMWNAYLFTDSPPKKGMRYSVGVQMQKDIYQRLNEFIRDLGIQHVTTCKFVEMNTGLKIVSSSENCGCMAHIPPTPTSIRNERKLS